MSMGFNRLSRLCAALCVAALTGCANGITGLALFPDTPLKCDPLVNVCGLSNTDRYFFEVRGHGNCRTVGIEWGDGSSQRMAADFNSTASKTWVGVDHTFTTAGFIPPKKNWPGPKQIHVFSVANCTGEIRYPYHLMWTSPMPDGSVRHHAAFSLALNGKTESVCRSLPDMADLRVGSRVIINELPPQTDMNFGCWFGGCINGPEGNAGPVTAAFPFQKMRRHSLVLRIVNQVGGRMQLVQGQAPRTEFVADTSGPLEFCVNDDALGDNSGAWGLGIQVDETAAR